MKQRKTSTTASQGSVCCGPEVQKSAPSDCCDQPNDGTLCCDPSASQEENSANTGCC